jgi:outer membrane protein OmpA-like peptidoglycan-associated protein
MNVTSYGENKPVADNATKEARSQNRRVALVVLE